MSYHPMCIWLQENHPNRPGIPHTVYPGWSISCRNTDKCSLPPPFLSDYQESACGYKVWSSMTCRLASTYKPQLSPHISHYHLALLAVPQSIVLPHEVEVLWKHSVGY